MRAKRVTFCLIILVFATAVFLPAPRDAKANTAGNPSESPRDSKSSACLSTIQSALKRVYDSCNALKRNSACYGHNDIDVQLVTPSEFRQAGDIVPLRLIKSILTSPLD